MEGGNDFLFSWMLCFAFSNYNRGDINEIFIIRSREMYIRVLENFNNTAFAPKAMSIAFIKILLPAPVSPVIIFKPLEKSCSSSSINM